MRQPAGAVASAALVACALHGGACGGAQQSPARAPGELAGYDARFAPRDLPPHTPAPVAGASGRDGIALRAADASEGARTIALAMVQALLDSDAAALQRLFAERVMFGMEGFGRPRAELVERCIDETRALAYEPELRPEHVVDIAAIEVRRAEQFHDRTALPPGIRPNDLLVTLPPRQTGDRARTRIACVGTIYVRVAARPQIVGLSR